LSLFYICSKVRRPNSMLFADARCQKSSAAN